MNTRVFESFSDKETFDIAFRIANNLKARAGNCCFIKGREY